ncbi:amino acid ABC transporter permease [Neptunomonas phycophila]|jgi:general L-amino acid transport system permease protein|uniref:Amino acid ABC transporter permease n=1 Tax=Neptunomonas phycophila TaxID=1572645 RepID=A0AAW7XLB4_9GAMM|nr:amino acid ABC transporter permease [Neptunomonas phycophila]MDO6454850.1 amino acid ABC transporter permease [Neptunomonas phycophila]QLE97264.1 amino acid ABC transporter permease [Neptunomonas phycophila]
MKYELQEAQPAPNTSTGLVGWLKTNLFNSPINSIATIVLSYFIISFLIPTIDWAFIKADWIGTSREACTSGGACWVFITNRLDQFMYGFYPEEHYWRINLTFIIFAACIAWLLIDKTPYKGLVAIFTLFIFPVIAFFLLYGGSFGLEVVETHKWGGLSLTLILAIIGIVAALPFGVILALGRRSEMPIVKSFCVVFIEFWRGVPLITVLFMASVMLPLFVPEDISFDKLLRALIGIVLFQSAYMAEVVRGGLQAIPKGQYEAADALGLGYWKKMIFIILPQALKLMIPGIVNTFIALFKDTSLVLIIGLFDLLAIVQAALNDPDWLGYSTEGYIFVALVFWVFCFSMSRYSQNLEKRLQTGHNTR